MAVYRGNGDLKEQREGLGSTWLQMCSSELCAEQGVQGALVCGALGG